MVTNMPGPSIDVGIVGADEYYTEEYNLNKTKDTYNGSMVYPKLPDKFFIEDSMRVIGLYCLMFILAAGGNVPVFINLIRNGHRKSRLNLMIMHLTIAELIVTLMIPLEIAWRLPQWVAGSVACKILVYMRQFGHYLSSSVIACISLDRLFTVVHSLNVNEAERRCKIMLRLAWATSILSSIPQSVIFHVERHPENPQFIQCLSIFPTPYHQMAYKMFCLLTVYGIPMSIIIFCYSRILWKMSRRSRNSDVSFPLADIVQQPYYRRRLFLRQPGTEQMERARSRTLRMTILLVLVFFLYWTPYVIVVMWNLFHPVSAKKVDPKLQSYLFILAVSSSCFKPLVYGSYALNFKQTFSKCCVKRANLKDQFDESLSDYNPHEEDPFRENQL